MRIDNKKDNRFLISLFVRLIDLGDLNKKANFKRHSLIDRFALLSG